MDNCLDPRRWISPGLLGEILEEVRSELKTTHPSGSHEGGLQLSHSSEVNIMDIDPEPKTIHPQLSSSGLHVETSPVAEESLQSHNPHPDLHDTKIQSELHVETI